MTIDYHVFDSIPPAAMTRHLFIDVEPEGDDFAIIVRGEDKARVGHGRANSWRRAAFAWNDTDGSYRRFVVATGGRHELQPVADSAVTFYRSAELLGARLATAEGNPLLPLLLSRFPAFDFIDGNASQRKVGSITSVGPLTHRKAARQP